MPEHPKRGQIVEWDDDRYVVVSGNMFNSLGSETKVIVVAIVRANAGLLTVDLNDGWIAVPGDIGTVPKAEITHTHGTVDVQALTDIDNMIARIFATN